ncbi:MAG: membrane protein insertion efficiency factor YidD [Deltaproteobacteria bacterium]|nr:membrane protein insertion efficiency factor YidD [Deltaproteobacteria bacterium]
MKKTVIYLVRLYQLLLAPAFGHSCRFTPTCSQYMIDAIERYGLGQGLLKGCWRIIRCCPFFSGGFDPA